MGRPVSGGRCSPQSVVRAPQPSCGPARGVAQVLGEELQVPARVACVAHAAPSVAAGDAGSARQPRGRGVEVTGGVRGVVARRRARHDDREARVLGELAPRRELAEDLAVLRPRLRGEARRALRPCARGVRVVEAEPSDREDGLRRALPQPHAERVALAAGRRGVERDGDGLLGDEPRAERVDERLGRERGRALGRRHVDVHLAPVLVDAARGQQRGRVAAARAQLVLARAARPKAARRAPSARGARATAAPLAAAAGRLRGGELARAQRVGGLVRARAPSKSAATSAGASSGATRWRSAVHWPEFSISADTRAASATAGVRRVAIMVLGPPVDASVAGTSSLTARATAREPVR